MWMDDTRDLATIALADEVPPRHRFMIADSIREGQKVHWFEYDFGRKFLQPRERKAKVVRVLAGHVVFDKNPEGGASGSCLLDENDHVVGIVVRRFYNHGVAVSVIAPPDPQPKSR